MCVKRSLLMRVSGLVLLLFGLPACAVISSSNSPAFDSACSDPRPDICTMEYVPVCAVLPNGESKTYGSGCAACSDSAVAGYNPGQCPDGL